MTQIGVEIECLVPAANFGYADSSLARSVGIGVAQRITDAGVLCHFAGYSHARVPHWKIVTDSSLRVPPGYVGLEVVSPPIEDLLSIEVVGGLLQGMAARVNKSCGLHVHVDARNMPMDAMKRLAYLYHDYEDSIDGLMPASRRASQNTYCNAVKGRVDLGRLERARNIQEIQMAINSGSRYTKLNLGSFYKHGTVEFRQHSGTVDPIKIVKWVTFCRRMVDLAVKSAAEPRVPAGTEANRVQARMRRARKAAVIYNLAARPEGVTALEMQQALGSRSMPSPSIPLERLGAPYRVDGRRGGHRVYKLDIAQAARPEDVSLPALLARLEMSMEDTEFWRARAALFTLTPTGESNDLNPAE